MMFSKLTDYALDNVTDYGQFESMCNDLMFRAGYKNLVPHGGMHDNGIDAVTYVHEIDSRIVFQYSTQRDVNGKVKDTLKKLKDNGEQCNELHYVSNREISYTLATNLIEFAKTEYNAVLNIYDREWIRVRLDNDSSDLRRKYFNIDYETVYNVDYKAYWVKPDEGPQSYVMELYWIDQSDTPVLQTNITATPSPALSARMFEIVSRGGFNYPTIFCLGIIGSICKSTIQTQLIDDDPVKNGVTIGDPSPERGWDFDVGFETFRLVPMPESSTVVYLLNFVPGVCEELGEKTSREISVEERILYARMVRSSGMSPQDIDNGLTSLDSALLGQSVQLLWNFDPDKE